MALRSEADVDAAQRETALERAFEELFRQYHSVIVAAAFNRLSNERDAEDAAAEVFSAAWRLRADQAAPVFTLPWLYGTLRNIVGNEYRRRDRTAARFEKASIMAIGHAPDAAADDGARDVQRAIANLDMADRELIWMAYWEDLTGEEIAAILGCSHTALRVRLHRAKRRLRAALAPDQSARSTGGTS